MKSILIIGLGSFGRYIAGKFIENGHEVMAIDHNDYKADAAVEDISHILIGDATDERFMKGLGIDNFDLVVIAISDNFQTTLEITVILKDLGCKFIVARASSDIHKKLLLRNGADYVSFAEKEAAERLAISLGNDSIFDFIELTPEIGIYEISVPKRWIGKTVIDLNIRNKHHLNVLATKSNGKINIELGTTHTFTADETIMVMGSQENVNRVEK